MFRLLLQVTPPVRQRVSHLYSEMKGQVFEVQPDQAEAGKDIIAQMVDNIREYEEPDLPEFIGLEALPPPTADLAAAAAAAVAAEAYEEDLQLYEKVCSSRTVLFCFAACLAWLDAYGPSLAQLCITL